METSTTTSSSTSTSGPASLPNPRLIVTSHSLQTGQSHITTDTSLQPFYPFGPTKTAFTVVHAADKIPIDNSVPYTLPAQDSIPRPAPAGTVFGITDFPPGAQAPMHRTLSLDYGFVVSGEIVMVMDSGEETTIRAGEFVLQRGTAHAWVNRGKEVCRVGFIMVGGESIPGAQ